MIKNELIMIIKLVLHKIIQNFLEVLQIISTLKMNNNPINNNMKVKAHIIHKNKSLLLQIIV